MNILVLSAGTRNKIIRYIKKEIGNNGNVVATDMSEYAPAIYEADKYYIVPRITEPDYIDKIIEICRIEKIDGVLSLIDPELSLITANRELFLQVGTTVIGSSFELCERALDKMKMYTWLENHDFKCAKSYVNKSEFYRAIEDGKISFPVIVKPVTGSASLQVTKVYDKETLELVFKEDNLMIQEYLAGEEIGADVYVDMISNETVSIFTKKKIAMRAGETDKAVSFKDPCLFKIIELLVKESGYVGPLDIDIFKVDGEYYISEVNPRFGGGYPHAYESGCNHIQLICNNLRGETNYKHIGDYDEHIYMMKYNEVSIIRGMN